MIQFSFLSKMQDETLSFDTAIEVPLPIFSMFLSMMLLLPFAIFSQEEKLEINGAIQISNSEDPTPDSGTIRWNGDDLEVYDGSNWVSLTAGDKLRDIDNNSYETAIIGNHTWMAENLRTTRYNDGTFIPLVTDNTEWSNLITPAYTWYNDDQPPSDLGALYNYYTVADTNSRKVCPTGWHVPTGMEWQILRDSLGGQFLAGGKMKETGLANWNKPNAGATNASGFTGRSGGFRSPDGPYSNLGFGGHWWSNTETSTTFASAMRIDHNDTDANIGNTQKGFGLSVRCIKD